MNVGLFTSVYFNNIGNGFIDLGAETVLNEALPENYNLIKVSQCANFAASMSRAFRLKEIPAINWIWVHIMQKYAKSLQDRSYKAIGTLDVMSVPKLIDLDYLIIPGCVLTVPFFTIYGNLLREKAEQGCKLIFLGASGNFYTKYEIDAVTMSLQELEPYALITRDPIAYENYHSLAKYSYNGIDNAFFVNRLDIPRVSTSPKQYVVVNLEEPKHKEVKKNLVEKLKKEGKNIIYSDHKPFPYSKISDKVKEGVIISDYPLDYLIMYKNASEVYSDRVHACIPTISFGNRAALFSDSPRKALFRNAGVEIDDNCLMHVNNLSELQNMQIEYLKNIFEREIKEENE